MGNLQEIWELYVKSSYIHGQPTEQRAIPARITYKPFTHTKKEKQSLSHTLHSFPKAKTTGNLGKKAGPCQWAFPLHPHAFHTKYPYLSHCIPAPLFSFILCFCEETTLCLWSVIPSLIHFPLTLTMACALILSWLSQEPSLLDWNLLYSGGFFLSCIISTKICISCSFPEKDLCNY